jgi:hypothetical protein
MRSDPLLTSTTIAAVLLRNRERRRNCRERVGEARGTRVKAKLMRLSGRQAGT